MFGHTGGSQHHGIFVTFYCSFLVYLPLAGFPSLPPSYLPLLDQSDAAAVFCGPEAIGVHSAALLLRLQEGDGFDFCTVHIFIMAAVNYALVFCRFWDPSNSLFGTRATGSLPPLPGAILKFSSPPLLNKKVLLDGVVSLFFIICAVSDGLLIRCSHECA